MMSPVFAQTPRADAVTGIITWAARAPLSGVPGVVFDVRVSGGIAPRSVAIGVRAGR